MPEPVVYRPAGLRLYVTPVLLVLGAIVVVGLFDEPWSKWIVVTWLGLWAIGCVLAIVRNRAAIVDGLIIERIGALRRERRIRIADLAEAKIMSVELENDVVFTLVLVGRAGETLKFPTKWRAGDRAFCAALGGAVLASPAEVSNEARWYLERWRDGAVAT